MKYPDISDKQKEINLLLFRFRILTLKQTQLLLNHKDHKTIRIWLTNLLNNNFIGKHEGKRLPGGNIAAVFYLDKNGLRFLNDQSDIEISYLKKMRDEGDKKQPFIDQCYFIVNAYINLSKRSKKELFTLKFYTPNDFPKKAKIRQLKPSFAYAIEKNSKRDQYCCEYIHATTPRWVLFSKIDSYINYFLTDQTSSPMHIKFVCQSDKRFNQAKKYLKDQPEEDRENLDIQIITCNEMQTKFLEG